MSDRETKESRRQMVTRLPASQLVAINKLTREHGRSVAAVLRDMTQLVLDNPWLVDLTEPLVKVDRVKVAEIKKKQAAEVKLSVLLREQKAKQLAKSTSKREIQILRHALGMTGHNKKHGTRKHYLINLNDSEFSILEAMESKGLVERGPLTNEGRTQTFLLTEAGCEAAELDGMAMRRYRSL